ncbi:MAG: dihydrolipoamide acetyltransferase family protein [Steroidobacteraceae bacterium]
MTTFLLPDLGEGLPDAEIVAWHVKEGDSVKVDQLMVSVETAKAIVEVPSPYEGVITKLHAAAGDVVGTGEPLVDFQLTGASAAAANTPAAPVVESHAPQSGTVVGMMPVTGEIIEEQSLLRRTRHAVGDQVRAVPAARALARRLNVDLAQVSGSGKDGVITLDDVLAAAPLESPRRKAAPAPEAPVAGNRRHDDGAELLHGPRRAMAQSMSRSRDEIATCTVFDDADVHAWPEGTDITVRLIRSIAAAVKEEPGLNARFDPSGPSRILFDHIHLAVAVDSPEGLIVPVIRDIDKKSGTELRASVDHLRKSVRERSVAPEEMRGYTFTLSNFGTLAGRYATPLVVPPAVAILGTGRLQRDVVPTETGIEVHRRIPLSLTFDHRCITGGEACRFLAALIRDLGKSA